MISRHESERSINQLLCLIIGGQLSRRSSHLSTRLSDRLQHCQELVQKDMRQAIESDDTEDLSRAINAGQAKLTSIQSLKTLNQLLKEVEW